MVVDENKQSWWWTLLLEDISIENFADAPFIIEKVAGLISTAKVCVGRTYSFFLKKKERKKKKTLHS